MADIYRVIRVVGRYLPYLTLQNPSPFPLKKFPSLTVLCQAVLRKISRKNLLLSLEGRVATSARVTAIEAQFQDEWYRAFYSILGHEVAMSSEWSRCEDGRIDFRIVEPSWGIDLRSTAIDLGKMAHITHGSQTTS